MKPLWLTWQRLSTQLETPVGGFGHYTRERHGLRLTIGGTDGPPGVGECSPLPGYSKDTLFGCERALHELAFDDVASPDLTALKGAVSLSATDLPAARHAMETALLDRSSRRLGFSAAQWIATALGQPLRQSMQLASVISGDTPEKLVTAARGAIAAGYGTLKIKLGPAEQWPTDKARLTAVREAIGSAVRLRLDINRAWPRSQAHLLEELVQFNPEFVEEPFEAGILEQVEGSPVPLALDEGLQQRYALDHFAPHLARMNVKTVVLKPMALGGISRCVNIAARARLMGLNVVISHLFDGPIALSVAGALAMAIGSPELAQGLAPHPALLLDPMHGVRHVHSGKLWSTDEPGLALDREEAPCSA